MRMIQPEEIGLTHLCGHPEWHNDGTHYIDCETYVLSAGCADARFFAEYAEKLTPDHFANPSNALMFSAMKDQWSGNPLIEREDWDMIAIADALSIRVNGVVDASGPHCRTFRRVWELAMLPQHNFNDDAALPWRRCVKTIVDRREKQLKRAASLALASAIEKDGDSNAAAIQLVTMLSDSTVKREENFNSQELFQETLRSIESPKPSRVITGSSTLDGIMGGIENGSLNILAGRPGTGKTTFAVHLARVFALGGGGVSFYSLEMTARNLGAIVVCQHTGIPYETLIDRRKMREKDYAILLDSAQRVCEMNMRTISTPGLTIEQFATKAARDVDDGKKMVVLDYLQLLRTTKQYRQRYDQVAYISGEMKQIALRLDIPIVALCQMNREVEKDAKRRWPRMADLRESGTIEQDADTITFLTFHPNEPLPDKAQEIVKVCLMVEKNRNGRVGNRSFMFDKPKRSIMEDGHGGDR